MTRNSYRHTKATRMVDRLTLVRHYRIDLLSPVKWLFMEEENVLEMNLFAIFSYTLRLDSLLVVSVSGNLFMRFSNVHSLLEEVCVVYAASSTFVVCCTKVVDAIRGVIKSMFTQKFSQILLRKEVRMFGVSYCPKTRQ